MFFLSSLHIRLCALLFVRVRLFESFNFCYVYSFFLLLLCVKSAEFFVVTSFIFSRKHRLYSLICIRSLQHIYIYIYEEQEAQFEDETNYNNKHGEKSLFVSSSFFSVCVFFIFFYSHRLCSHSVTLLVIIWYAVRLLR